MVWNAVNNDPSRSNTAEQGLYSGATGIAKDLQARVRPFLDLVDAMRKLGVQNNITVPQIAVMGDQSSGKSSVLEAISGIHFPRGTGLVTRCATQITMSKGTEWSASLQATIEGEVRTIKAAEEVDLTRHIEELTDKLCGPGGFCGPDKIIEVKLEAPDVPDLTIIDLPGIVRTHTAGQSEVVKEQVDGLLDHYLKQSRTIILAVIPTNVDIATVDILERARRVDPDGERTIGVLTKPDLVDRGAESEVMKVLANQTKPLLHGYFMLKNRSQEELQGKNPLRREEARNAELAWLRSSQYAASNRLGVQVLQSALTELLVSQIEKALPSMLKEVVDVLEQTEAALDALGDAPPTSVHECRTAALTSIRNTVSVLRRVTTFADPGAVRFDGPCVLQLERGARKEFVEAIQKTCPGFYGENDRFVVRVTEVLPSPGFGFEPAQSKMPPGARLIGDLVNHKWTTPRSITKVGQVVPFQLSTWGFTKGEIVSVSPYFRGELLKRIEAGRGRELPGFMNFDVFSTLMGEYVDLWEKPAVEFQQAVKQALTDAAVCTVNLYTSKLPSLAEKLKHELRDHIALCAAEATSRLDTLLGQEKLPSTENHYLWDTINKVRNQRLEDKIKGMESPAAHPGHLSKDAVIAMLRSDLGNDSNESQEVEDMIDFLSAYWKLAVKRYIDHVGMIVTDTYTAPKCIEEIERRLTDAMLTIDDRSLVRLFGQTPQVQRSRSELTATRAKMLSAQQLINEFDSGEAPLKKARTSI